MSLVVSPLTGNSHKVSRQFVDDNLDLFIGGFAKDTCEDGMRHLCLNALGRNGVGSHRLGGMSSSRAKGMCLVGSDDDADDADEKSTGRSIPVLGMCCNIGMQLTTAMVPLTAGSVASLKWISIRGCIEKGCGLV
jgi:hypothetical protein